MQNFVAITTVQFELEQYMYTDFEFSGTDNLKSV